MVYTLHITVGEVGLTTITLHVKTNCMHAITWVQMILGCFKHKQVTITSDAIH